jgi:hypothetical protein
MRDALRRLEDDVDAWVATADRVSGTPYLVPLSFLWDGETLLFATPEASVTIRNLRASGNVRVGVGETRDVVLIEGSAELFPVTEIAPGVGAAFAAKCGFDPRELESPYVYFRVRPVRVQAWREANELPGRELMRNGAWIDS